MLPGLKSTTKIKYDSLCNINILGAGCDGKDKERIMNVHTYLHQSVKLYRYNTELLISNLITYLPIRYVGKLWCLANAHAQI